MTTRTFKQCEKKLKILRNFVFSNLHLFTLIFISPKNDRGYKLELTSFLSFINHVFNYSQKCRINYYIFIIYAGGGGGLHPGLFRYIYI